MFYFFKLCSLLKATAFFFQSEFFINGVPDEYTPDCFIDLVISDMAPPLTGHTRTDHLRIMGLVQATYLFACEVLNPDGCLIAKVFQGGTEQELLSEIKKQFRSVKHAKPPASRSESSEIYVIAQGFRNS